MAGRLQGVAAVLLGALVSGAAWANDSTAELATGGLVFVHNDRIEMRSEDLYISAAEIRVRYRFANKTDRDVTVLVAFPMPEIAGAQDRMQALPTDDPVNLLDFRTLVNGRPVEARVEQRAFAAGIDRTQFLIDHGIPLAPHLGATNEALDRLPREKWDEFLRLGLAEVEQYDIGRGMQEHLAARWSLRTNFYWEQHFPAATETAIEHRYRPSVGESAGTALGAPGTFREAWFEEYRRKYCIEKDFLNAVARAARAARNEYGAPFSEERIDYVLRTGANWAGPIGAFRLVVDKGDPENLVSFCAEGLKKISPTQFEMQRRDFRPEADLSILILKRTDRRN